jgi:hypothetical protein
MPSTERPTLSRSGKWTLALIVVVVVVGVLRELGVVDFELQTYGSVQNDWLVLQGQDEMRARDLRIEYVDGERRDRHLVSRGGEPLDVTVRMTRYDLSGRTWTPLFKHGRVEYEFEIVTNDPAIGGTLSGTLEASAQGLLSRRAFRAGMRADVHARMLRTLTP